MLYQLNHDIQIEHISNHIHCSNDEFIELWNVSDAIESTPNPMNKKYMIKRKQCTFGATYNFGGQSSKCYNGTMPNLVKRNKRIHVRSRGFVCHGWWNAKILQTWCKKKYRKTL